MGGWERKDRRPPGWLPPSPACTQGLPAPMCALRLLAASPPRVSTPLWPISSIFITFCNARSRVPNLKSTLFPNVFVTSIPRPSGRAFPNAELRRWGQPGAQCPEHAKPPAPSPTAWTAPVLQAMGWTIRWKYARCIQVALLWLTPRSAAHLRTGFRATHGCSKPSGTGCPAKVPLDILCQGALHAGDG